LINDLSTQAETSRAEEANRDFDKREEVFATDRFDFSERERENEGDSALNVTQAIMKAMSKE